MNRTWKDAACEVAWRSCKNNLFWSPLLFLLGYSARYYLWDYIDYHNGNGFIRVDPFHGAGGNTFENFRAAFMKWLDENEVKK